MTLVKSGGLVKKDEVEMGAVLEVFSVSLRLRPVNDISALAAGGEVAVAAPFVVGGETVRTVVLGSCTADVACSLGGELGTSRLPLCLRSTTGEELVFEAVAMGKRVSALVLRSRRCRVLAWPRAKFWRKGLLARPPVRWAPAAAMARCRSSMCSRRRLSSVLIARARFEAPDVVCEREDARLSSPKMASLCAKRSRMSRTLNFSVMEREFSCLGRRMQGARFAASAAVYASSAEVSSMRRLKWVVRASSVAILARRN